MGTEISDGGFNPVGKRDGEKMSQQVFVGVTMGKNSSWEQGWEAKT